MGAFTNTDVVEYYHRTKVHYRRGWDLDASHAMHYGFHDEEVASFRDALSRMNEKMAEQAKIDSSSHVLDAGCGFGGSSVFLAERFGCRVSGVNLVEEQVLYAQNLAKNQGVDHLTEFVVADYTSTPFEDGFFDVIWAMESVVHCKNKLDFYKEAFRLLKPGGVVVLAEYVQSKARMSNREHRALTRWLRRWAITGLNDPNDYEAAAMKAGFQGFEAVDVTRNIRKSSWRMFYGSIILAVLSTMYWVYNPRVSRFAHQHYQSLFFQYIALRKGLWKYAFLKSVK